MIKHFAKSTEDDISRAWSGSKTRPIGRSFHLNCFATFRAMVILWIVLYIIHPIEAIADKGNAMLLKGDYFFVPTEKSPEKSRRGDFVVSVKDHSWIINYKSNSALTNSLELDAGVIASCDGTNVYVVHKLNPASLGTNKVVMTKADIYGGIDIPPLEGDVYRLWLAFVSGTIWTNSTGKAKPFNAPDLSLFYNADAAYNYNWITNNQDKYVREFTIDTGARFLVRDFQHNGKLRYYSLPSPFTKGYIMAVGRWLEATNLAGVFAPTRYEFKFCIPRQNAVAATDLTEVYSCQCLVTDAYIAELESIPVGLQGDSNNVVLVTDYRFAEQGVAFINYGVKTNKWTTGVSTNFAKDIKLRNRETLEELALKQHGFILPQAAAFGTNRMTLVRIVIGATLLLPLVVLFSRGMSKKRKQQKQKHTKEKEEI